MIKAAIVGATGYGGAELVRLLSGHPGVELVTLTSQTYAGQRVGDVYPNLAALDYVLQPLDLDAVARADVIFFGLPHGEAMKDVPAVLKGRARVIDLSGDFRLKDAADYPRWYGFEHTAPHLLAEAVYGLVETRRAEVAQARLVANPGCFPTGALLAVLPLLRSGLADATEIVVDSKTGISGAGRTSLKLPYHYPEADEDVAAYKVPGHQHIPEMEQEMSARSEEHTSELQSLS
jgi:N-acetyl-gamma-glutamyl-phosphate reductase